MKQPKDHNGKPITDAQLRMLRRFAEGETIGGMSISGGGEERTWTSLRDRGLISNLPGTGVWLTRDGLNVCRRLFTDMEIEDLADPFRGENCGIDGDAIELKLDYYKARDEAQRLGEESASERKPREDLVMDVIARRLSSLMPPQCITVMRAVSRDGRGGYEIRIAVETENRGHEYPYQDYTLINRSAFVATAKELDVFCLNLHVGVAALVDLVVPPAADSKSEVE